MKPHYGEELKSKKNFPQDWVKGITQFYPIIRLENNEQKYLKSIKFIKNTQTKIVKPKGPNSL